MEPTRQDHGTGPAILTVLGANALVNEPPDAETKRLPLLPVFFGQRRSRRVQRRKMAKLAADAIFVAFRRETDEPLPPSNPLF
jgi:hypothetical protein